MCWYLFTKIWVWTEHYRSFSLTWHINRKENVKVYHQYQLVSWQSTCQNDLYQSLLNAGTHTLEIKIWPFSLICFKLENQSKWNKFFSKLHLFKEPLFIPRLFSYYILMLKCPFFYEIIVTIGCVYCIFGLLCFYDEI